MEKKDKDPSDSQRVKSGDLPTLSDLMIGFQKSMARVAQTTAKSTKEDPLFLYGRRNLYYIDEVDVETVVRINPEENAEGTGIQNFENIRILTEDQMETSAGEHSPGLTKLKFKLVGRTLDEHLAEPMIFIRLITYRPRQQDYLLELQVMNADGTPGLCDNITVEIMPDADERKKKRLSGLNTNELGIINLRLLSRKDVGSKRRIIVTLTDGKKETPRIGYKGTYLIRAFAKGEDMKPKVDLDQITVYAPLIINRSEFEGEKNA